MISVIIVNWYSGDYIKNLLNNLKSNAKNPDDLRIIIIDNTNGKDASIEKIASHDSKVTLHKLDSRGYTSSRGHSYALNYASRFISTEYALLIDPDVHIFKKHWDSFCIEQLRNHNCIAIGAPYPFWKTGKYHNFPSPIFCFFNTKDILKTGNDWTAFSDHWWQNMAKFFIRQFGRLGGLLTRKRMQKSPFLRKISEKMEHIFGVFSQDTGWRIADQARKKQLKSIPFSVIIQAETELTIPANMTGVCQELASQYELYGYDKQAILTHKYGTGVKSWRTEKGADEKHWRKAIEKFEKAI